VNDDGGDFEGGLGKQRRNVLAVSLLLVFYYAGGGTIQSEFVVSSIAVKLAEPQSIIVFMWLGLAYLTWRYWLYAAPLRSTLANRCWLMLRNSEIGPRILTGYATNTATYAATKERLPNSDISLNLPTVKIEENGLVNCVLKGTFVITTASSEPLYDEVVFTIPAYKYSALSVYFFFKAIMVDKEFSYYFAPFVTTGCAIVLCAYRRF
jgi:hypothetical protein